LGGLLALGTYPQQFYPNFVIQAYVTPGPGDPAGTRAIDSRRFDGAVPEILEQALLWVLRNTRTRIRFGDDGHGRDEPEYPADAVRELLSNSLVHRDLGPHAFGEATTLRLEPHQLVLSNPGGLWGLSAQRLGRTGVSSARNSWLLRICQNIHFGTDQRVVEALATGIPTVLDSLSRAGMAPPQFHDQAVRFTVRIPNHTLLDPADLAWLADLPAAAGLNDLQRHALVAMRHGVTWTNRTFREAFPMDSREALEVLNSLVNASLVQAVGARGGRLYRLAETAASAGGPGGARTVGRRAGGRHNTRALVGILSRGAATISELTAATGLSRRQVHYALTLLREEGTVRLIGGQGSTESRYELDQTAGSYGS
jgi:ATP-dependent DNA helicase RecG